MKIFPFTTLQSESSIPTLVEIAKRLMVVSACIGASVGGIRAVSAPTASIAVFAVAVVSTTFLGGGGFTVLFYAITRIAQKSGYRPFLFIADQSSAQQSLESRITEVLQELGFKKEDEDLELGSVWILSAVKKEEQILINQDFPLRAYIYRKGLKKDGKLAFVLQIKGTPIWDTGETAYLREVGNGIMELAKTA